MIPSVVHIGTQSQGEREIFHRLHDDPETNEWIVLHSLDVANHVKNIAGEIDFVVIVPNKGVLCLEIKGCSSLKRSQGAWYYGADVNPDYRGPFKQASEGMHAIRNYLSTTARELSSIVFWSAVVFPFIDFSVQSDEWHTWQVIDSQILRSKSIGQSILFIMDNARSLLSQRKTAKWFNPATESPNSDQCKAIANILRPSFEFFESPGSRSERLHEELKYYTLEQYDALDTMQENPRVAFIGPAGTGKTLLAIEAARRSVSSGRRVLLLCYNRFLGNWLKEQTSDLKPHIICNTLHSQMLSILNVGQLVDNVGQEYWEKELPRLAVKKILSNACDENLYDEVIIDEAQDILSDPYLDFIDVTLKGGWASGRWRLFGDFEKQAIYARSITPQEVFLRRCKNIPMFSLRCNCRNSPRVAELVHLLGGLTPPYRKVLRSDDGVEPTLFYYEGSGQQQEILISSLEQLHASGFAWDEIVVLSSINDDGCIASSVDVGPWSQILRPFLPSNSNHSSYATIHAFKGMEAPAIIVTDIEHITRENSSALFYIAITRTLQRLIIIANSSIKKEMINTLLKIETEKRSYPEAHP